jgi:hypothetical protein
VRVGPVDLAGEEPVPFTSWQSREALAPPTDLGSSQQQQ